MSPGEAILRTLLRQSSRRYPQHDALAEWEVDDLPPTLAKATSCEACGHPIKRTVKLFNGSTSATLIVGYDCYEHFVALSKGLQVAFNSVSDLKKERERSFIRVVERGHLESLRKARPLHSGTWTSWIIAQARQQRSLDPLVLEGIEAIRVHGFIISRRQLDACIRHHDEFRVFQAALIFGDMWSKFAASSQSPFTIAGGRARLAAHALAEKERAARSVEVPPEPVKAAVPALAARSAPVPDGKPASPLALATSASESAPKSKTLTVFRINAGGGGSTSQRRKRKAATDRESTKQQGPKERRPRRLVLVERVARSVSKSSAPPASAPPAKMLPPRAKPIVDLAEHEKLRAQAKFLIDLQSELREPDLRLLRARFLSQISRVETANAQGRLAEATRPLDEIRTALHLLERRLGMR